MAEFRESSLRRDIHHDDGRVHRESLRSEVGRGSYIHASREGANQRDDPLRIGRPNAGGSESAYLGGGGGWSSLRLRRVHQTKATAPRTTNASSMKGHTL